MKVVQVGLGNFGKRHIEAWHSLGFGDRLWIADSDESKWAETARYNFPRNRLVKSLDDVIDQVDVVDIVTPTQSHFELCKRALEAGKDVFIEKPMTMTLRDAVEIAAIAERTKRLLQVGYYYRYHPISQRIKTDLKEGRLGRVRYLTGNFFGFKRARNDVGVTHTDGIHFIDLFNWFQDAVPVEVYAICRDHFKRGLEDFSIVLMTYADGTVAKVESGYVQPGRWKDKVVPGALTSKDIVVVGEALTAEADFETESLTVHDAHHELRQGTWAAIVGPASVPPIEPCSPVQMVARELEAFLACTQSRAATMAGPVESGVHLAAIMEAIYESARTHAPVKIRVA